MSHYLGHSLLFTQECQHEVLLVISRKGNQGIHVRQVFILKQIQVRPVSVNYQGARELGSKIIAAILILFYDLYSQTVGQQAAGEVKGGLAPAQDHHPLSHVPLTKGRMPRMRAVTAFAASDKVQHIIVLHAVSPEGMITSPLR